ncbi:hypothetical protein RI570_17390 [Brucella pseudogrignonensis]|uniref:hypothetical protein n=1 Tax=Brucella pseudogrignonensis TaxID=419475 RepID=UPI0028BC3E32|nr:hypothetical protein [Brucella pseudogrignonensis]MDT6941879.1 hypothetical protein [Brucella pseudogrignonensis]
MAPRTIALIGRHINSDYVSNIDFESTSTLLDWDITIFVPEIGENFGYYDEYQGKPSLNENESFRLTEQCEHWRREIKLAVDSGKTVICYLSELREFYVDTGKRNHSGTGKNRQTTHIVSLYSNYHCFPLEAPARKASGTSMKLSPKATALSDYWKTFGNVSTFLVTLGGNPPYAPITTKTGDLLVGGIYSTSSGGSLVLLPSLDFYDDAFFTNGEYNDNAKQFADRITHSWLGIDSTLRSDAEVTPTPQWADSDSFLLLEEKNLKASLLAAEQRLVEAQKQKEQASDALREVGSLRGLLYEKGTPLEGAIIKALRALGFEANNYKDATSEFDVVFSCPEGRLLGEAEGKDNKPINIDKLRQLAMNIHEDLEREDVTHQAKPVLFGNGYRLQNPSERSTQFTEKCISAAQSSGTCLVQTSDLFRVAKYLSDVNDQNFAKICRETILTSAGIATFPEITIEEHDEKINLKSLESRE